MPCQEILLKQLINSLCMIFIFWFSARIRYTLLSNVSTLLPGVFIKGDLKLLRDSLYTLTNERLFLLMRFT